MSEASQVADPRPARVSVVIPAADEADNIGPLLEELHPVLRAGTRDYEVLVVIPHPDDPTGTVAEAGGARVLSQMRPGYGGALKEGILAATGDYVVTLDGDGSHPPARIAELLRHRDDAEVVICSRYVEGGSAEASHWRGFLSRVLNTVYSRALALPARDVSSGFRIYQRRVFDELELWGEKYDVLEEILVKVYSQGWRIAEIPFDYLPRISGESHARPLEFLPHFVSTLFRLFRLRNHYSVADYDSRAYDSILLPQRYWQRRRFALVEEMAGSAGRRVDIGCGSSRIIQSHPDSVGIDVQMSKLRFLRRTNRLLVRAQTFALPLADASFDVVVHSHAVEHMPYDRKIFTEIARVLRRGGTLVIGTPDRGRVQWRVIEWLYRRLMPTGYGDERITRYTRQSLIEELAHAGFAVRRYAYILGAELVMEAVKRDGPAPAVTPRPRALPAARPGGARGTPRG